MTNVNHGDGCLCPDCDWDYGLVPSSEVQLQRQVVGLLATQTRNEDSIIRLRDEIQTAVNVHAEDIETRNEKISQLTGN